MRLFEMITAQEAKKMLLAYADSVVRTDFDAMVPALKRHFPEAVYTGGMYRAVELDIDNPEPMPFTEGQYYSWSKSPRGLDAAIADMFASWAPTLAIYEQTYEGIDVNAVLGQHDHANEEEIIAQVGDAQLQSFRHEGESWPPDIDMIRSEIGE